MSRLRVHKNGEHLCSVGSDDVWMFCASVWADVYGPEASFLEVSGSAKPTADGRREFLIWQLPYQLYVGDSIEFFFEIDSSSFPRGVVLPENVTDSPDTPEPDWSIPASEEQIRALESRTMRNCGTKWSIELPNHQRLELQPVPVSQHISLRLIWNDEHPQRLRVSLARTSFRAIASRIDGEQVLVEYFPMGSRLSVNIGA
jgi:hypothetical protein